MKRKAGATILQSILSYLVQHTMAGWIFAVIFALGGVYTLSWMLQLPSGRLELTNSIWSVVLFAILLFLLKKILHKEEMLQREKSPEQDTSVKRHNCFWPFAFGFLFSVFMIFGVQLEMQESVPFSNPGMWLAVVIGTCLFGILVKALWDRLSGALRIRAAAEETKRKEASGKKEEPCRYGAWLKAALLIFICYLPVFLAVFPGFFVYDAQDEYLQVVTRNFSTHHPLVHVLLLGGIIQLVYKLTASYNAGIACYTLFQMLVMSGIFGWVVWKLQKRGLPKWSRVLLTLYFGLCPVLVMFSLCSAKDGLFTGMLLIQVILLQDICRRKEGDKIPPGTLILFFISSLGMMLLRHNGYYAFLVFAVILILCMKKYRVKTFLFLAAIVAAYSLTNAGLTMMLHAEHSEKQEKLTVPVMQLARVYAYEQDSLSAADIKALTEYLPGDALERYTPKVSDQVKIDFNNNAYEENKAGFWSLWLQIGRKHPFAYANAWLMTSYGFWYPDTIIDTYRGNTVFTYTYEDSSYFGYEVEQPGTRQSLLPWLNEIYRRMSLEITQQKIPVVSMLFAPGFLFLVFLFGLGFGCYMGEWKKLVPYILPLLCFLTVLLGPACLVRYVVFLWVIVPVLMLDIGSLTGFRAKNVNNF